MRRTSLDIDAVRARMRQLVTDRVLACDDADQTWTGDAIGKRCDGCREPIRPPDVELEAEMPDGRTFVFHERCHEIWREVCDELSHSECDVAWRDEVAHDGQPGRRR